jgi:hypothetical protein
LKFILRDFLCVFDCVLPPSNAQLVHKQSEFADSVEVQVLCPMNRGGIGARSAFGYAIALSALFFVETVDVGSDRVNLLGTQNDIRHAGVLGAEKNLYSKFAHRRHTADVHEIWCTGIWAIGLILMTSAAHRLSKVSTNIRAGRLCAG